MPQVKNRLARSICSLLGVVSIIPLAAAQTTDKSTNITQPPSAGAHLSIIALGAIPIRCYTMPVVNDADFKKNSHNRIPRLLPPKPHTTPPNTLFYRCAPSDKEDSWAKIHIGFNNSTTITQVHPHQSLQLYTSEPDLTGSHKKYVTVPALKAGSQNLVFLTPNNNSPNAWKRAPTVTVLNLHSKSLNAKNLLVKNFSNKPVIFAIGKHPPVILAPRKKKSFTLKNHRRYHKIIATEQINQSPLINTAVSIPEGSLTVIAFYNSQPQTKEEKSVGAFRTTVHKLPPKKLSQNLHPES